MFDFIHPSIPEFKGQLGNKKFQVDSTLDGPRCSFEIDDIPLGIGPMTGKFKISNENVRVGAGAGVGKLAYVGGFLDYDFESGQLGVGAEVEFIKGLSAEGLASYNWENDSINFKASLDVFDQKIDLVNFEVKDVAQNTVGKAIDNIRNGVDDFVKHVSPEEKAKQRFAEELKNDARNVRDIHELRDVINKMGENELAMKGNEAMYQLHYAELNYLNELDHQVNQNTEDIKRHEAILVNHENRLNEHDKILAIHEKFFQVN